MTTQRVRGAISENPARFYSFLPDLCASMAGQGSGKAGPDPDELASTLQHAMAHGLSRTRSQGNLAFLASKLEVLRQMMGSWGYDKAPRQTFEAAQYWLLFSAIEDVDEMVAAQLDDAEDPAPPLTAVA